MSLKLLYPFLFLVSGEAGRPEAVSCHLRSLGLHSGDLLLLAVPLVQLGSQQHTLAHVVALLQLLVFLWAGSHESHHHHLHASGQEASTAETEIAITCHHSWLPFFLMDVIYILIVIFLCRFIYWLDFDILSPTRARNTD